MVDIPVLAAQTLTQDTHIRRSSDIALPTAAEQKTRHRREPSASPSASASSEVDSDLETASISSSPNSRQRRRRRHHLHHHHHGRLLHGRKTAHHGLPPLPDLRFEQSYLASIAPAKGDWWKIFVITVRDQVVFPLVQGTLFSLALLGWRAWNRKAKFVGKGLGARIRRWWWRVNKWNLPEQ